MKFEIITLFPDYFSQSLRQSLLGRALDNQLFDIEIIYLRDFATDKHRTVDDTPFGGGGGMVLKVDPLDLCLKSLGYAHTNDADLPPGQHILLTSAAGQLFDQETAIRYSLAERVTIICGHYLGVDERILSLYPIEEVSLGDYVLTGGEPAAAVLTDAIARLIPGVLGNFESALEDSHMNELLGSPVYTRPADYEGLRVPDALLSGNHAEIERFRRREAIDKCLRIRPELLEAADLTDEDRRYLRSKKKKTEK